MFIQAASQRAAIIADMKMIEDATRSGNLKCITFVPRTNQVDYVRIVSKEGCYSEIGKRGGAQLLSLSIPGRCVYGGVIAHELVHALGMNYSNFLNTLFIYSKNIFCALFLRRFN